MWYNKIKRAVKGIVLCHCLQSKKQVQEKFDQPAKGYVSTKVKIELLALCKFTILILQHANKEQKIIIETARFIQA